MSEIVFRNERIRAEGINVRQASDLGIEPFPRRQPHDFSRRGRRIDKIAIHWTGGERSDPRAIRDVLVSRQAGAHFFMDKDGNITQYLDLARATVHGAPTATTIGIEIQNRGIYRGNAYGREVYEEQHLGRRVSYLTFTPAQIRATKKLCRILCNYFNIPYRVPKESDGTLRKTVMERSEIRAFSGILGHYHISTRGKRDPGLDLLRAINDESTSSTVVEPAINPTPEQSRSRRPERRPQQEEEVVERIQALTQGRTEPPANITSTYGILTDEEDASTLDPHVDSGAGINEALAGNIISAPYEKWFNQMAALRQMTNLDLAQTTPIIQILVREKNDVVNLNELIFGESSFKNIFDPNFDADKNPERPIASISHLEVDVQSPSAGGGEGQITILKLHLKIHNPHLVTKDHPRGKYISYMMRASYAMRIRYGVSPNINSQTNDESVVSQALQWCEQDFYVSQHEISVNDDLTMNMVLTLLPGEQALFNQVLIGENFPADATSVEVENTRVSQDQQTQNDVQSLITQAMNVSGSYGGMNTANRFSDGTLGSVLHGMTRNIDIILPPDGPENIQTRRENLVNALRSIQSSLLTQRTENVFNDLAYLYTRPGDANLQYAAVNTGPFIERMVAPELQHIVSFMSQNDLRIGTVYSTDAAQSDANNSTDNEPPSRTNVQMVFGNFNNRAGDWAGKPISTFPLNMEKILSYVRENRDVGRFQGSINGFINKIHQIISDSSNYIIDRSDESNRFATPIIKYSFYPHPEDPTSWIFYLYDQKQRAVGFSETLQRIADEEGNLTKDKIKALCEANRIPWIEPGINSSLIRTMNASTQAGDTIASRNLLASNSGFNTRQMDASNLPSGISRDFVHGLQLNLNEHIANTTVLLPLHLSLDHFIAVTTVLFGHVYVFFPLKQFSSLYSAYELKHEVQKDRVSTKMTLNIQVTRANQSAD